MNKFFEVISFNFDSNLLQNYSGKTDYGMQNFESLKETLQVQFKKSESTLQLRELEMYLNNKISKLNIGEQYCFYYSKDQDNNFDYHKKYIVVRVR